ncbi:ADL012Cp [Eremothecium gossypii ATCC 10895]|uniref:ADL012Cp n=1 Tax=Eremothecium gossypii (strain ATCC 10895 / CBS 109.51 / FGSC 9923 / NRRL Y-1056) TaxID=284811 RepID=Q75AC9_EREGS|nr:ADL012Cp [Eremothecium gossypii ATCC 10895]AAS51909.2 ADL012Cp [Eremothecium gossypii ATCC 10895]AEY96208.1 FADL012Cp [Eremothecium gossypii FDAG1]
MPANDLNSAISMFEMNAGTPGAGAAVAPCSAPVAAYHMGVTPAEQHEALQSSSSTSSSDSSILLGELVFEKFACADNLDHEALAKLERSMPMFSESKSSTDLDSAVENFFGSSSDSTPLFEFEGLGKTADPKTWSSLFDDDIPVTLEDVGAVEPISAAAGTESCFLPTPIIEDAVLKPPKRSLTKRDADSVPASKSASPVSISSNISSPALNGCTSASATSRRRSSVMKSEKYDHLGVITYNRKQRATPLTPVVPESDDPVALKRARNTEAARRSRARKLERMNQLEERVEQLLQKNSELEAEVARLRSLVPSSEQPKYTSRAGN